MTLKRKEIIMIQQPDNLGPAGRELWENITDVFDFRDEPAKETLLERCARTADTIAALEAEASTQSLTARGSMGQAVVNPLIAEARSQTSLLDKLLKSLGLPETEEEQLERAQRRSRAGKTAARARWGARS